MNSFFLNLWVTTACNFRCRYCYEKENTIISELSLDTVDDIILFIKQGIHECQTLIINFHGGEPLLKYDIIKYTIDKVRTEIANTAMFGVTTNGSLLDDNSIAFLAANMTFNLSISLDGKEETHNVNRIPKNKDSSYNKLFNNALKILSLNDSVRIRMTFDRENIIMLSQNIKFFLESGFKHVVPIADFCSCEWIDEDFNEIYEQLLDVKKYLFERSLSDVIVGYVNDGLAQKSKCTAGHDYYSVDCNGFIYPCTMLVGVMDHCIGHVKTGIDSAALLRIDNINEKDIQGCTECDFKQRCISSRCLLINYATTGSYLSPNLVTCNMMNVRHRLSKAYTTDVIEVRDGVECINFYSLS